MLSKTPKMQEMASPIPWSMIAEPSKVFRDHRDIGDHRPRTATFSAGQRNFNLSLSVHDFRCGDQICAQAETIRLFDISKESRRGIW